MSTRANRRLKRRLHMALILVTMILLLVTSFAPRQTSAQLGCGTIHVRVKYFSGTDKLTQCGYSLYFCDGSFMHSGCYTDNTTILECECGEQLQVK